MLINNIYLQEIMNIERTYSYQIYILNSLFANDVSASNRLSNEIGQNNLENSFLQKKRNLERAIIYNHWKNNIIPKKETDFFILKKKSENLNEIELLKKSVFKEKTNDEILGLNENIINSQNTQRKNSILENQKINVDQMNSNKKNIFLEEMMNMNSNEIKVMKNNKIVYANNIDSFSKIKKIRNKKYLFEIRKRNRGSKYRGVSKNGNQWQVLIMFRNSKSYIGTYSSEELAARVYDISAIKNKGVKAITNFNYSPKQINNILSNDIDIKAKNINLIILDLLKEK